MSIMPTANPACNSGQELDLTIAGSHWMTPQNQKHSRLERNESKEDKNAGASQHRKRLAVAAGISSWEEAGPRGYDGVNDSQEMHNSSLLRMGWFVETYLNSKTQASVLDVGSYNVNGSYRELFKTDQFIYTGLDMESGPNVDLVPKSPYQWREIEDDTYDVVISGQALEHIEFFWVTLSEMVRSLKEGGLICIIAPNGFGEHRYPVDCWRFFTDGMVALARYTNLEVLHADTNCAPNDTDTEWFSDDCADSILVARKPYSGKARILDLNGYQCVPADHAELRGQMVQQPKITSDNSTEPTQTRDIGGNQSKIYKIIRRLKRVFL